MKMKRLLSFLGLASVVVFVFEGKGRKRKNRHFRLGAKYFSTNILTNNHMAIITLPKDKGLVHGTLIPLIDGVAVDLSQLVADSDAYTSSDDNVALVSKDSNGNFTVKRNSPNGGSCTIHYKAINLHGFEVTGSDDFVVEAIERAVNSLSASYGAPE